ncbi:hypothetical protein GS399_14800 [Pedobacter sp. HMF7647]|uniref:Beta-galactosidase trimerisation domain-containing protein n=1 Tax=Hufsiella arboris TaxID=2695275 RepID=A0A7K1YCE4_9SPHI|nr:beta-galactosidase trimerization domain-containing protein [Hufsiella arboris]MXV52245.1 hypothetical protein [Hufsiella arboris]
MSFRITDGIFIGAEVFIEPGQTQHEIDTWFLRLRECGMNITRIRLFETYMKNENGNWDFSLFDMAYKAGDKYGIKIYGNLFPETTFDDVGGFKFPRDDNHLQLIADYIKQVVMHFSKFDSHAGWVPINEPGAEILPENPLSTKMRGDQEAIQIGPAADTSFLHFKFEEERFLLSYNSWYLNWLSAEILKYEPHAEIHVNNHAIFKNVAEYDFPAWRKFLTSFGGSAHASWHFGYFKRHQYTLAVSANCEIIRSGAGETPWLMTELQGGNNTMSAFQPLCPTKEEITQWLWLTLASGGKGAIFWCLNPRMSGFEAGEWAMLNYQDEPSDRMLAAADVIKCVNKKAVFFENAVSLEPDFNVLYVRESLWVEKKLNIETLEQIEARTNGAVMRSSLTWFETLTELGIQPAFKEISEFDFDTPDFKNSVIILSHQVAIPAKYYAKLEAFVAKGGTLIVDGLTAYYDEWAVCRLKNFPLKDLFGAEIKEFKVAGDLFDVHIEGDLILPAHMWRGELKLTSARSLGADFVLASENLFGEGRVLWIPSPLGLGARVKEDRKPLAALLRKYLATELSNQPFRFDDYREGVLMKSLRNGNEYLTVIINKSGSALNIEIKTTLDLKPEIIYPQKSSAIAGLNLEIEAEETVVLLWDS